MKFIYRIMLILVIIGGVNSGIYGLTGFSFLRDFLADIFLLGFPLDKIMYILIGVASIIVLLVNFSISFAIKPRKED